MQPTNKLTLNKWSIDPVSHGPTDLKAPAYDIQALHIYLPQLSNPESPDHGQLLEAEITLVKLDQTDLSKAQMDDEDWKTLTILHQTYPHLFKLQNLIKVTMNGKEAFIEKRNLLQHEAFRMAFALGDQEQKEGDINLNYPVSAESTQGFLDYLSGNPVNFTEANVTEYYQLAEIYSLKDLENEITLWLEENLSANNLCEIMQMGLDHQNQAIIRACLSLTWNQMENEQLQYLITSLSRAETQTEEQTELLLILQSILTLKDSDFFNIDDEYGKNFILAPPEQGVSDEQFRSLDILCQHAPIEFVPTIYFRVDRDILISVFKLDINLSDSEVHEEVLKNLMERLPHLCHLDIVESHLKKVPGIERLKTLKCTECNSLTALDAPEAEYIITTNCDLLKSLHAPKAQTVIIERCPSLRTLSLSTSKDIKILHCPQLNTIRAPLAKTLCYDGLLYGKEKTVEIPNYCFRELNLAGYLSKDNLSDIIQVGLDYKNQELIRECLVFAWKEMDVEELKQLITANTTPGARQIYQAIFVLKDAGFIERVSNNQKILILVPAPNHQIDNEQFRALDFLCQHAPISVDVYFNSTIFYDTIAPEFELGPQTNISQWHENFIRILMAKVPHLSHLNISNSQARSIPGIERIKTLNCTFSSITSLNVPEGQDIYVDSCPIEILNAPKAISIHVEDCENLKTLSLPSAKQITIVDCDEIETIEAPHAEIMHE